MNKLNYFFHIALFAALLIIAAQTSASTTNTSDSNTVKDKEREASGIITIDTLILAGGCFWCVESDFEKHPGVIDVVSGYTGGSKKNPSYEDVTFNNTGHYEAVKITFDVERTNVKELTEYFWSTIDPTDPHGQFCDKGHSYKSALFYQNEQQKTIFEESLAYLKQNKPFKGEIATKILSAKTFYLAEEYHQDYYAKSPFKYYFYRTGCGRDSRIKQLWGNIASKQFDNN